MQSSQLIVVMRHGEREDHLPGAVPLADPRLTSRGRADVRLAARSITDAVGPHVARRLKVISSPFLRTIETAQELMATGVGRAEATLALDNSLCEVFGPVRIQSALPPDIQQKDAVGQLPLWGETIQLAELRFVDSFVRNAQQFPAMHLLLVTHGDAIASILHTFYPMRTVYNCEFLGFLVLRQTGVQQHHHHRPEFTLTHHCGVQWMLEAEEADSAASAAASREIVTRASSVVRDSQQGSVSPPTSSQDRTVSDLTPLVSDTTPYRGDDGADDWRHPAPHDGADEAWRTALRCGVVATQALAMRVWPSIRNGAIYCILVLIVELLVVKYNWRNLAERLPFLLCGWQGGCPALFRWAPVRTAVKALAILLLFTAVGGFVDATWGPSTSNGNGGGPAKAGSPVSFMDCYKSNFAQPGAVVVYALFFGLDMYRGWREYGGRCDDRRLQ